MDRGLAALLFVLVLVLIGYLIYAGTNPYGIDNTTLETADVIINNPETVVVSDRTTVSDTPAAQTTVPVQAQTTTGQPITVARTIAPGACPGVCATACPATVIAGQCPYGTICCT